MPQTTTDDDDANDRHPIDAIASTAGFDDSIADLARKVFEHAADSGAITEDVERAPDGRFTGNDTAYPTATYAAAVYAAARIRDIPTKPAEVAATVDFVFADMPVADDPERFADDVANHYKRMLSAVPFEVEPESPTDWVRRLCDDLGADDDFETAAVDLSEAAIDAGLHVGKSVSGFAAAVVYAASKHEDAGFGQAAVADAADVALMTVRNNYPDVLDLVGGGIEPGDPDDIHAAVNDVCDRIDGLPAKVRADAVELAKNALDADARFARRTDPHGVAAGCVYVTAKDARVDVSQTEVAKVAGVSKSTVVNRVNDLRDWKARAAFDDVAYNDLKRLADKHDVVVGATPEREYLVDRLVEAEVEP